MLDTHNLTTLVRRLAWFAGGAVTVIAATIAAVYVQQHKALVDLAETREFARIARSAAALSTDRETSIRAFLLTRDRQLLARDITARAQLPKLVDSLAAIARGDDGRLARLRAATEALNTWDRNFAAPAERGSGVDEGGVVAGKRLFDVVRSRFTTLIEAADARYAASSARLRTIELLGAGIVLGELLIFFGLLLYLIRGRLIAQAYDLGRQQELLEQQAVELELQMDETASANRSLTESITDLQQKDEELRTLLEQSEESAARAIHSEERYRYVAKATNDVVYEWDAVADVFEWSEGMRDLFGYGPEDIESSLAWIMGLIHPEDVQRISDTFSEALKGTADRWQQPYRLRRKDGKYASVEGRLYILRGADGAPTRVIGAISDRSTQQSLEEQLRQAQKMDAVGRLAGGVAHDFNNILTVIRMSSEFLLQDLPDVSESRHEADEILRAADRAAALTRQLLAFSRHQILNPRVIVLNEVVEGIQGMVKRVVPENISVSTDLARSLDAIRADTGQLEQVILNLVINAADAMPGGGRLDIRTANVEVDEAFSATHLGVAPGEYVCLTVSDTGHGMDRQTIERIFDPFFTTKAVGKGTGLGLATVHGIVAQSGGKIWVYSEPGLGTTFKIFLPKSTGVATKITPRRTRRLAPATETILLVEDEESTRDAVHRSLTRAGYKVLLATNGKEALRMASDNPKEIALVLTDAMMPEMGGLELVARLREINPDVAVLMMSGYTEETAGGIGATEHEFIEKPFASADLLAALRRVLDRDRQAPAA